MKQPKRHLRQRAIRNLRKLRGVLGQSTLRHGSGSIRFETLEDRLMLASDLGLDSNLPADPVEILGLTAGPTSTVSGSPTFQIDAPAEGENTPEPDLVAFAQLLAATPGVKYFAAIWCPACNVQKALFEDGADFLPFIEVTNPDRTLNAIGITENITSFPTWEFPDGSRETGVLPLETIAQRAGVAIPTGVDPFVAPIGDRTVYGGSPLHVALNGYDPNGGPLTFTVVSSNPSLVQPTVLTGNRSARVTVTGWGEMVFELFEDRVPRATERFITLAESGFYDSANNDPPIKMHRVIDNFILQFGDPTGTGAGGSPLGPFDDHFHRDLQHNTAGAISWAKSTDDTNNSQVFVTDVPTRFLDFNHSYFGQLTEGDKVRNGITATATNASNSPLVPINITSVGIFTDTENAVMMLKAAAGATGAADITVTVTDEDGNPFARTFQVTVAADPFNGGPFLVDIPPIRTTVNTPAAFTISAIDVEGDPVLFDGVKVGSVDYTLSVDSQTGNVVVTPPTGFVGVLDVILRVRPATTSDTADLYDTQRVSIVVAPTAPLAVDLLAESDSGHLNDDNLTNLTSLSFVVTGVTSGAQVRLHHGSTVLGQATASGSTATIVTSALTSSGDGTYNVFATQVINGVESDVSPSLAVTLDTTPPAAFTSTPPSAAAVGQLLTYDTQNPAEGAPGAAYALVGAPSGAVINPATGILTWTPTLAQVGAHSFAIVLTDAAGNTRSQDVDLSVTLDAVVIFRLDVTTTEGTPITSADVGDDFLLNVYVRDVRENAEGVFAAFLDVVYNPLRVTVNGTVGFGPAYANNQAVDLSTAGLVNETGAVAGFTPLGGSEFLLFRVPLRAIQAGEVVFTSDPADQLPAGDVLLFGDDEAQPANKLLFGSTTLTIEPAFQAIDDSFTLPEGSSPTTLDVLENDEVFEGSPGNLTIVSVTSPTQGGTVEIATDGLTVIYTPAANFFGDDTFTYTASDGTGTRSATVTVEVTAVNDNPLAVDDVFTVSENAVGVVLNVLANDSSGPDTGETLTVVGFSNVSAGGTLVIATGGTHLVYTPATNFSGTETFTYTISDGQGGTAQANVSVVVTDVNNPPLAQDDLFDVLEDSVNNALDVLENDSTLSDPGETLTITAVTTPDKGGTVSIAADGLTLIYSPLADFFGIERFSYTISDGRGGTAQASVVVTVQAVNDPPTANNDAFTVLQGTTANPLNVLANDTSAPDAAETLTIVSVGTTTAGGSVSIATGGLSVLYTPLAGFTGVDTFTYTMQDPGGLTDQATVTVDVLDYVPSSISGYVFLDVDNSGTQAGVEAGVGGVVVTLAGTNLQGANVALQQTTNAQGLYQFVNLAPGTYRVTEVQPSFLIDGIDSGGSLGTIAANDQILITLPQDTQATNLNFGERGRTATMITVFDFFASTPRDAVLVSASGSGTGQWYAIEGGWSQVSTMNFQLQLVQKLLQLDVTTTEPADYSAALSLTNPQQIQPLGAHGTSLLMRIVASPESLLPNDNQHAISDILDADATTNFVLENAAVGTSVGITARAEDLDPTDTVSYSLDVSADGRFAIHATTGVVTVAGAMDREQAASYDITVRATSTDGSLSTRTFTIDIGNVDEFDVSAVTDVDAAPNFVLENATVGTLVGMTAAAEDLDATDTVTFSLDNSAGGRFAIDPVTGVVTLAGAIDYEAATSHTIVVRATSTDSSFSTANFVIEIGDVNEFGVADITDANAGPNFVLENAAVGTLVGITALAEDEDATDTVSYSLDDDADGRFAIDPASGVVTVAGTIDYETATSHTIVVRATSTDGSFATAPFLIEVGDVNISEITDVDAGANFALENAAAGTPVGITAQAEDLEGDDAVAYSLDEDADGRFAIDPATGVVTVNGALDFESATSHTIVVRATLEGSTFTTRSFTIEVGDVNISAMSDADAEPDFVLENSAAGTPVGLTASAEDLDGDDTVTYSLINDAEGRLAVDPTTGVVTVAGAIDREVAASYDITVRATLTSDDFSERTFTIAIGDVNEFDVSAVSDVNTEADFVVENAAVGTLVGITASAEDQDATDTVTYSLDDDAGGRFAIDSATGVVTVAGAIDYEETSSTQITVRASSTDGSFSTQTFPIAIGNVLETGSEFMVFRLEVTQPNGTPVSSVTVGDDFLLNVYVQDVRDEPEGVFAAFVDLFYDEQLVGVSGALTFGSEYPNLRAAGLTTPGLVDEAGAMAGFTPLGGTEYLLWSLPLQAILDGVAVFTSDPSDLMPANEVLLYGDDLGVPNNRIFFGSTTVTILPESEGEGEATVPYAAAIAATTLAGPMSALAPTTVDDGIGHVESRTTVLMAPTPADGYLATDWLLAADPTLAEVPVPESWLDDEAEYAGSVDDVMAELDPELLED